MTRNPGRRNSSLFLGLAAFVGLSVGSYAGDLEPPGAPAPTMVTLQEIYDKLDELFGMQKTGQKGCWDASGNPIACAGTGQDGEYQTGVSVVPRFADNLDGTVTDNLTGLIWLKNANCFGTRTWANALSDANTLTDGSCGLTDSSVAGDWRLPNVRELHRLVDFGQWGWPPLPPGHPFSGVQSDQYWSSTSLQYSPSSAWLVTFTVGQVSFDGKSATDYVWPVRGGQ